MKSRDHRKDMLTEIQEKYNVQSKVPSLISQKEKESTDMTYGTIKTI